MSSGLLCAVLTVLALGATPQRCLHGDASIPSVPATAPGDDPPKPWFCHDNDCPTYTVEQTLKEDVELRSYESGVWVSTNISGVHYDKAVKTGFMRLFAYISGANVDMKRIPMTSPVRVEMTPGAGPFCEDHFTVSFFVPHDLQDATPEPLSSDVFIDPADAASYYVLSYSGRTRESEIVDMATQLVQELDDDALPYLYDSFFFAGYDSPFRIFDRHNEVWIKAGDVTPDAVQ